MNQLDMLRMCFDQGGTLSVGEAMTRFGIYALSQRCGELRRDGYPIDSMTETLPNGKRISRYYKLLVAYG
jgi:hypothetical protein